MDAWQLEWLPRNLEVVGSIPLIANFLRKLLSIGCGKCYAYD